MKSYDQPRQHIKKQRHYFAFKVIVKGMIFPVVMYGCETWTKKAECGRTDAFKLVSLTVLGHQGYQTSQS